MQVYEKGVGYTKACGSGACAVAVVCHRKGLCEKEVNVVMDGGVLRVKINGENVYMIGQGKKVFVGEIELNS